MLRSIAILLLSACAMYAQSVNPSGAEKQDALGKQLFEDLLSRYETVEAPEAHAYIEGIVRAIAAAQPEGPPCCTIAIHDGGAGVPATPTPLPGGHLLVPAEFFRAHPNEADFVRGIVHALAHIRLRDWTSSEGYSSIPLTLVAIGDDRKTLPRAYQGEFDAREQRADALVPSMMANVTLGTGGYERALESLPPPPVRPSLLSGRPSLVR